MSENQALYRFEQISKITGIPERTLELRRKATSVPWSSKGYTPEEVRTLIPPHTSFRTPAEIGGRAKKALALLNELLAMGQEP